MAAQYSFVMKGMTKTFPGAAKPVLSNIHLQFYPDAKIGIVGPNGSGKSTLMKIMAGRDTEFVGEAWPGENITVGYLEQEPQLDPAKTVKENVMDGVRPVAELQPAVAPHNARDGGATTGARLDLEIAAAGTYRVAIDHGAWIDLVKDGQPLRPAANGRGPACSSIHRILDFALTPGRYVLQLSGTVAASARLLVVPR